MIHPTFEEWWNSTKLVDAPERKKFAAYGWSARDAEIADLKRQLAEQGQKLKEAEAELALAGDCGFDVSKAALDAYVQEKVNRERQELADEICIRLGQREPTSGAWDEARNVVDEIATNRGKVKTLTPADPPKESGQ